MNIKLIMLVFLLLTAVLSDLLTYKIKNYITYSFMLLGIILNISLEGRIGIFHSLKGIMLPLLLLLILYMLGVIGAGDIKLLSAIGAIMGPVFAIYAASYSFIWGGVIAICIMLLRKNGAARFRYLMVYITSCFLTQRLLDYTCLADKGNKNKFHFSVAVAFGAAVTALIDWTGIMAGGV